MAYIFPLYLLWPAACDGKLFANNKNRLRNYFMNAGIFICTRRAAAFPESLAVCAKENLI